MANLTKVAAWARCLKLELFSWHQFKLLFRPGMIIRTVFARLACVATAATFTIVQTLSELALLVILFDLLLHCFSSSWRQPIKGLIKALTVQWIFSNLGEPHRLEFDITSTLREVASESWESGPAKDRGYVWWSCHFALNCRAKWLRVLVGESRWSVFILLTHLLASDVHVLSCFYFCALFCCQDKSLWLHF